MGTTGIPPEGRYCDLVMKGGITSGIVYPPLVAKLSASYHFKNIGGTSAGAIAAAATAAAEYRRRKGGALAPFPEQLGNLPLRLSESVDGHTKLFSLFQAEPGGCRRLFRVLVTSLNAHGTWHRVFKVLSGLLIGYWPATLISLGAAWWIADSLGTAAAWPSLAMLLLATIGIGVYLDFTRGLVANNYGLCTGMTARGYRHEALTPWLHGLIQELASKPLDQPLTFEDLWAAPGFPPEEFKLPADTIARSIDLRMFTTNLSTGRPFVLPFTDETCRIFFEIEALRAYLPETVLAYIQMNAKPYEPRSDADPPVATMRALGLELMELAPERWPVVLAARLSLSFPLLFAAVPFWAIDYDPVRGQRTFKRCLFSDGGISSNFPVHLFDGLLPMWPTFGVQLEPKLPDRPNMIYLPARFAEGYGERWDRFDEKSSPGSRLGGFLAAVVNAMQNWNDNTMSRMAGVRDRVVRVRLNPDEGGMNLNMEPDLIKIVAERGEQAAQALLDRFDAPGLGWRDQRWIRFRVALEVLRAKFREAGYALSHVDPLAGSYEDLVTLAMTQIIDGEESVLSAAEGAVLRDVLTAMTNFEAAIVGRAGAHPDFVVMPSTDLKVRPSL